MFKGRELMGLPVISLKTGKETGLVEDLILDLDQNKVTALSVRSGGWLPNCRLVSLDRIHQVKDDAVVIDDEDLEHQDSVQIPAKDPEAETSASYELGVKSLKGRNVLSGEGKDLGTVEDVVVGLPEGKITGWEISDGLVQDLVDGRRVLPCESVLTYESDRFIAQDGGW